MGIRASVARRIAGVIHSSAERRYVRQTGVRSDGRQKTSRVGNRNPQRQRELSRPLVDRQEARECRVTRGPGRITDSGAGLEL